MISGSDLMKKPELLAPAGTMLALKAAIEAGCDAVYLGGYSFGARSYAGNFSDTELKEAITYAHLYGVRVYVTVNTIVYEEEMERFFNYVDFLVSNHVDALIVQDLGMMDYLHQVYPTLELHASTQMHIHTLEGVKKAEEFGLRRVVLARETPLEEIKAIKKNTNIELEVFVYGALCVSYSGQCLMSSMQGSRSGNRGTCAQCCRMKYHLSKDNQKMTEDSYLLSTKDLNTLPFLEKLLEAGAIDSFKIEGRMKRPEYVFKIISLYRKAIDSYFEFGVTGITEEDLLECQKLFYRGFTKGFLLGEDSRELLRNERPNHQGIRIGTVVKVAPKRISIQLVEQLNVQDGIRILNQSEDQGGIVTTFFVKNEKRKVAYPGEIVEIPSEYKVAVKDDVFKTSDTVQLEAIQQLIMQQTRKISLKGTVKITIDQPLELEVSDGEHNVVITSTLPAQSPLKAPISKERLAEQLGKLGGSVYQFETLEISDIPFFLPIAEINEMKRKMVEELNEIRIQRTPMKKENYSNNVPKVEEQQGYSVLLKEESSNLEQYDVLYATKQLDFNNQTVIPKLGNVYPKQVTSEALIGEIGSIKPGMISDYTIPATNSYTVAFLHRNGIKRVTLSLEMNKEEIKDLVDGYRTHFQKNPNLEVVIDCLPEVMTSKITLLKDHHLSGNASLVDLKNREFPVIEDSIGTHIYHYERRKLDQPEELFEFGINYLRVEL